VKFCGAICEILRQYYPQIPNISRPVRVVALTDNTSKCKEFIVTSNTKTYYIRPLMSKKFLLLKNQSAMSMEIILCLAFM